MTSEEVRPEPRDLRRDLWVPEFEARVVEFVGHDWPVVYVEKWERNGIGERRYIDTRARDFEERREP